MQAIVVTLDRAGAREETKVFVVKDDRHTADATKAAEEQFTAFVKGIESDIPEEDMSNALDEGAFDEISGQYRSVTLTWVSDVQII